jgi:yeast amino acid transporter
MNQLDKMSTPNSNPEPSTPPDHTPSPPSPSTPEKAHLPSSPDKRSIPIRIIDSFRRDPNQKATETGEIIDLKLQHGHDDSYDIESAITNIAKSPLSRKLEARHLQMIAIGGAIGMSSILWSDHVGVPKGKV